MEKTCKNCKYVSGLLGDTCNKCNDFWLGTGEKYSEWVELECEDLWDDVDSLVFAI